MNKIIFFILCAVVGNIAWAQDLSVYNGGSLYVSPESHVFVKSNFSNAIQTVGNVTVSSDENNSGVLIVEGSATGTFAYQRFVNATGSSWHLVSPPVGAGTQDIKTFAAHADNKIRVSATNYAIAGFDNSKPIASRWVYQSVGAPVDENQGNLGNFNNGIGYSTSREEAGTYTFEGALTVGNVDVTIGGNGNGWTSIGNPYTAFLSKAEIFTANKSNINSDVFGALYFWNPELATYVPFNLSSVDEQLHPGQAFMVNGASDQTSNFSFSENLRAVEDPATGNFQRAETAPSIAVRLTNGTDTSSTFLKYFSNTTSGLDTGWDAGTFNGTISSFAIDTHLVSDSNGIDFTLQCLPDSNYEASIVPLSVKAAANQEITFSATVENLPQDINVYLEDKVAEKFYDINLINYKVTLDTDLSGIGRFYLHTTPEILGVDSEVNHTPINVYTTSNTNLRIATTQQGAASVKVYTILGKEVLSSDFQLKTVNDIALPSHLASGIYLVQLETKNTKLSKKIILE